MFNHTIMGRVALSLWLATMPLLTLAQGRADGAGQDRSGRHLVRLCETEETTAANWCAAYLMGLADTLTAFGKGGHKGGLCGAEYQIGDLSKIFLTWMRRQPDLMDLDMLAGASLSLRSRWPCR